MAAPSLPFTGVVEAALDADLSAPEQTWTWTALNYGAHTRLMDDPGVTIHRGRADERGSLEPASWQGLLRNGDGELTPRRASSSIYPHFRRGTPLRFSLTNVGLPHLLTTGATNSRAGTPDHADFPTGDWFIGVEVEAPFYFPPSGVVYEIAGKFNPAGQRSLLLYMLDDGALRVRSSPDGTAEVDTISTAPLPRPITGTFAFAVWFDVSSGANRVLTVYSASTLAEILVDPTGTILETVTTSGTTSVFNSTAPFDVGDVTGSGFSPFPGRYRKVQVRAGDSAGTVVTNPDFTIQTPGATGFNDTAPTPKAWTVTSPAVIEKWQTRFVGQITDIKPAWAYGDIDGLAMAKVEASGVLQRLQQGEQPIESALTRLITSPSNAGIVVAHWPHEDGRDSTRIAASTPGVGPMSVRGEFSMAADDQVLGSSPLMTIAPSDTALRTADIPQIPQVVGVNWEVGQFMRAGDPAVSPAVTGLGVVSTNGRVARWLLTINDTQLTITGLDDDGAGVVLDTTISQATYGLFYDQIFDDTSIVVLRCADDGVNVDWSAAVITLAEGLVMSTSGTYVGDTGVPTRFKNSCTGPPGGITFGHTFVTTGTNLAGGITWLAPADRGFRGESAADRIRRLCAEQNIPITIVGDAATSEPMGPQRPLPLTDLLAECAATDRGVLSELPNTIGFGYRCRNDLYNPTSAFTVTADLNLSFPFEAVEDDQRLANDVTVTRTEGSSHREVDQAHIDAEDRYRKTLEVNTEDDNRLPAHAGWILHEGTWPEMRYPAVPVDLVADSAMHEAWLHAGPGDTFTVTGLPDEHPTPAVELLMEGYTETLTGHTWDLMLDNSPSGPSTVGVWDDEDLGRYDTAGSETTADFEAGTDTSLTVATTLGQLWTTDGDDVPFEIQAAGVVLTVTAVAGASSPQTFTVDATPVNGVEKTIPAGSDVRLAQPSIVSL